jgi:N-glycosylase/DNA lyase
MRIKLDASQPFDLEATLCCGQAFRWEKQDDWWTGVVANKVLKIRQKGAELQFENVGSDFVKAYFGLNDDLMSIYAQINKDSQIGQAIQKFDGLRILRQDPWECLVSYICATYKNIPAIKRMLQNLAQRFGEKISFDNQEYYAFPTPERLAEASITDLKKCSLGYRVHYVQQAAKKVNENESEFAQIRNLTYEKAKAKLLGFSGVGLKVADCILLFSMGKLEAFPVDRWINRVILRYYSNYFPQEFVSKISCKQSSLSRAECERLSAFGRDYFGKYAGYAQEYLYHYERSCQ